MKKFLVKRIGYMIVTLVIIITATFYMMHSIPGDPLAHMARNLPEQTKANYYAKYGLDKSTTEQYGIFMKNLITKGDLGESWNDADCLDTDRMVWNCQTGAWTDASAEITGICPCSKCTRCIADENYYETYDSKYTRYDYRSYYI